ncbi:MAG: Hsp20/alpha crystallin family protein [Planctomycetota bacterium]
MAITDLVPWRRRRGDISARREYDDLVGSFYRDMNNLVDSFFGGFDIEPFDTGAWPSGDFAPSVDVRETDKEIKVTAELPGMDEKDIEVSLSGDSLTIRGEKQEESEDKGKDYYRSERRYGSFHRVVPLSAEVDEEKVKADFKKGVLKIRLPKTAQSRSSRKKIEIKTG